MSASAIFVLFGVALLVLALFGPTDRLSVVLAPG
jgi:hypothetical protein